MKNIKQAMTDARARLNVPDIEFSGEYNSFPRLNGTETALASLCEQLGARPYYAGRSGFKARNEIYICVGGKNVEASIALAKRVLSEARQIQGMQETNRFFEEFFASSQDGGLSGYVITGGKVGQSVDPGKANLGEFVYVGETTIDKFSDSRRKIRRTYCRYYINKSAISGSVIKLKLADRHHRVFLGRGGETIQRLQRELGVRIELGNPDFSESVFEDFLSYATSEVVANRLPKRYEEWATIVKNNALTVRHYQRAWVRAGGALSKFTESDLAAHYRNLLDGKRVNGMRRLMYLLRQGELASIDKSRQLMAAIEQANESYPNYLEVNGITFNLSYEQKEGEFSVSTRVVNRDLDSMPESLTLPDGRKVLYDYYDKLPGWSSSDRVLSFSKARLVAKLGEIMSGRLRRAVQNTVTSQAVALLPKLVTEANGFDSSQLMTNLSNLIVADESVAIEWKDRGSWGEVLARYAEEGLVIATNWLQPFIIGARRLESVKVTKEAFWVELGDGVSHFVEEGRQFETQLSEAIQALMMCEMSLFGARAAKLEGLVAKWQATGQETLADRQQEHDDLRESVPEWLLEEVGGERYLQDAIDVLRVMDAVSAFLANMSPGLREASEHELSCGKARRGSEMEKLCNRVSVSGTQREEQWVKDQLVYIMGSNKAPYDRLFAYLFDEDNADSDWEQGVNHTTEETDEEVEFDPDNPMHVALRKAGKI